MSSPPLPSSRAPGSPYPFPHLCERVVPEARPQGQQVAHAATETHGEHVTDRKEWEGGGRDWGEGKGVRLWGDGGGKGRSGQGTVWSGSYGYEEEEEWQPRESVTPPCHTRCEPAVKVWTYRAPCTPASPGPKLHVSPLQPAAPRLESLHARVNWLGSEAAAAAAAASAAEAEAFPPAPLPPCC